jgi:putative transposase
VKYVFIKEHQLDFSIRLMCSVLEVSESGYYRWRKEPESKREKENALLLEKIRLIHKKSRMNYGCPKVYQALRKSGEVVNYKRVERLMRENGVRAKRARKFKATTSSKHKLAVAENLLDRNFKVEKPDEVWTSDITYIWTEEGWLYLVVFLDLYSRMVVGWAVSETLQTEFVERAFLIGQQRRGGMVSPLVHSDRGSQYASLDFREKLLAWNCRQSMSRKGNCWDNAVSESFFSVLKTELVFNEKFAVRQEAKDKLFDYIEVFYNRSRIHSATDYLSPMEYEQRYKKAA